MTLPTARRGATTQGETVALSQEVLDSAVDVQRGGPGYRPTEVMESVVGDPVEGWEARGDLREGLRRVVATQGAECVS